MTPIDIACRKCTAQPGESCFVEDEDSEGQMRYFYLEDYQPDTPFHAERVEDAAAMSHSSKREDPELVDEAVTKVVDDSL